MSQKNPIFGKLLIISLTSICFCFLQSVALGASGKKVRLLFPVEMGSELTLLSTLISEPKLYTLDGKTYVLAAEFDNAKIAFRLGKSIQTKLKLPFVLAYDSGHPQSNFDWLQAEVNPKKNPRNTALAINSFSNPTLLSLLPSQSDLHSSTTIHHVSPRRSVSSLAHFPKPSFYDRSITCSPVSKCLSEVKVSNPLLSINPSFDVAETADRQVFKANSLISNSSDYSQVIEVPHSLPTTESSGLSSSEKHLPLASSRINDYTSVLEAKTNPNVLKLPTSQAKTYPVIYSEYERYSPFDKINHVSKSIQFQKLANSLRETVSSEPPKMPAYNSELYPSLNRIPISPVSSFAYSDPGLVYLFVRILDDGQFLSLNSVKPPQAFFKVKDSMFAQVAVYNSSRLGRQALDHGLITLAGLGLHPVAFTSRQFLSMAS